MDSTIGHIYLYVSDLEKSYVFYKPLLEYLGYTQTFSGEWGFAFKSGETSLWFERTPESHKKEGYHRRRTGLNHLAFHVENKEAVDKFYIEHLKPLEVKPLYNTPKHFPEYTPDYYAVFFEDPDGIKLEVACYS